MIDSMKIIDNRWKAVPRFGVTNTLLLFFILLIIFYPIIFQIKNGSMFSLFHPILELILFYIISLPLLLIYTFYNNKYKGIVSNYHYRFLDNRFKPVWDTITGILDSERVEWTHISTDSNYSKTLNLFFGPQDEIQLNDGISIILRYPRMVGTYVYIGPQLHGNSHLLIELISILESHFQTTP